MEMKKSFKARVAAAIALLISLALASCDFGIDGNSFQNKAGAYFKEMTSTAAISAYQITPDDTLVNKSGVKCVPSSGDHTVNFILRNPQKYTFTLGTNMDFALKGLDSFSGVEIAQDPIDKAKITVSYNGQFLYDHGIGTDISPLITLYHPVSHANFGTYTGLPLSSDNPPPLPAGAVVMQSNETPSRWILCFNLPSTGMIKKLHTDLSSVQINGQSFETTVDSSGTISYPSGAALSVTEPAGMAPNQNTGLSFVKEGQSAYYATGDEADENERIYEIILTDAAGLASSVKVSARGFKLSPVSAYLTTDTTYSNPFDGDISVRNIVGQEDDGSAHIKLRAEAKTQEVTYVDKTGTTKTIPSEPYDPSDAKILYEVYEDSSCVKLLSSGTIKGLEGTVTVPGGTSFVKAYVQKPLYSDSDSSLWNCRAVCTAYFVSAEGSDDAAGSKAAPLATIKKAVQKFEDGIASHDYDGASNPVLTVQVMTDLSQSEYVAWNHDGADDPVLNINGYDGTLRTLDYAQNGAAIYVQGGKVTANFIKFANCSNGAVGVANGAEFECADCAFVDCYRTEGSGGAIFLSPGILSAERCTFERCQTKHETGQGGAILVPMSSSATLKNCSIKECRAPSGAAIYNSGYLLIYACEITQNVTSYDYGAALYHDGPALNIMAGASKIIGNKSDAGVACDIYLQPSSFIYVGGKLTDNGVDSEIGVYMPFTDTYKPSAGSPIGFTSGYSNENYGVNAGTYFRSNHTSYGITDAGAPVEAAFAVSGGSIYNAFDYDFTFTKAAASPSGMYPGMAITLELDAVVERQEKYVSPTPLYINPADLKLYTDEAYEHPASGSQKVEIKAELHMGGGTSESLTWTLGDKKAYVYIPAKSFPGEYTVKFVATFLGLDHPTTYTLDCSYSAENAAAYIQSLNVAGTYPVTVEGGVGAAETDGLNKVADAIRSHGQSKDERDGVYIKLDASATTNSSHIGDYNLPYFKNCAALKTMVLPDWIEFILPSLFEGCVSLESVSMSSNTEFIMQNGFKNCESLASIDIPKYVAGSSAYHGIQEGAFVGCAENFKINFAGTKTQWGAVQRPDQDTAPWHPGSKEAGADDGSVQCSDGKCGFDYKTAQVTMATPLTLEAIEAGAVVTFKDETPGPVYYSVNGGAEQMIGSGDVGSITLANVGDTVAFYGVYASYGLTGETNPNDASRISCDKPCYLYGNIMSLIKKEGFETLTKIEDQTDGDYSYAFAFLFMQNTPNDRLRSKEGAPLYLPATTLSDYCYLSMFEGCKGLTIAPELNAPTLTKKCYNNMFRGCSSLTRAPDLPAETLAESCYEGMFQACSSLAIAPDLPAETLAESCYKDMFTSCTSLENPPSVSATSLAPLCCAGMFYYCSSLTSSPILRAPTLVTGCYSNMFYSCTSITTVTCLASDVPDSSCLQYWLSGVTTNGTFYGDPAALFYFTPESGNIPATWTATSY